MAVNPRTLRVQCPLVAWTGASGCCQWCGLSLAGVKRRRTWCSDRCFERFQEQHVWSHAKKEALTRAGHKCSAPGCPAPTGDAEVLHLTPLGENGYGLSCEHHQDSLIVLCRRHRKAWTKNK